MMLTKYDLRILRRALRGELKLDSPRKRANAARVERKLAALDEAYARSDAS
jgi:hypothetical protein